MQKYVQQLVSDLEQIKRNAEPQADKVMLKSEKRIEQILEEAIFKPLEEWLGLSQDQFPPVEQLSEIETTEIVLHLTMILDYFGYIANFPPQIPIHIKYQVLVQQLSQPSPSLEHHTWQLALCGYDADHCRFGPENCQCKEWENILFDYPEWSKDQGGDSLKFVR